VILHRCFPWADRAGAGEPGGALWLPREHQGDGRHDNPDEYGCLYVAGNQLSAVVEQLAVFREGDLTEESLLRDGLPLALAAIELPDVVQIIDLDDPELLMREELRPSRVATRHREVTQPQALALYRRHRFAAGLRWWSTFEALWPNFTIFERAAKRLQLRDVRALSLDDPAVVEAAAFLGLAV
jgi:hypothetical protein